MAFPYCPRWVIVLFLLVEGLSIFLSLTLRNHTMEYQEFALVKEGVQADERGRISLGGQCGNKHYRIMVNPNGEILLLPMAMIPENEAWLFRNPTAKASLEHGLNDAREGRLTTINTTSFSSFADSIPDDVEE